jgi:hypothetical protein
MRMIRPDQTLLGALVQGSQIDVDLDSQNLRTLAAIDGQ